MLDKQRIRRQMQRLYRKAVRAGLTDLGVRMRNETARDLRVGETIIEDEPVLVGDAQSLTSRKGSGLGRWGWMVITSERAIWSAYPDRGKSMVSLSELDLVFSEAELDTYRWNTKRRTTSVTLGFLSKSAIREILHSRANDNRHVT